MEIEEGEIRSHTEMKKKLSIRLLDLHISVSLFICIQSSIKKSTVCRLFMNVYCDSGLESETKNNCIFNQIKRENGGKVSKIPTDFKLFY